MKLQSLMILTIGLCLLSTASARAQVPALLPVQGQLTNEQEQPLTGEVSLSFSLYEQPEGGTAFYETTHSLTLNDGTFSVYLGQTQPLDFGAFPASGQVFIGLVVDGGEELSPRIQIGTVPYAARASVCEESQTLSGATAQDFATVDHAHDYSELTALPSEFPPTAHGHSWSELSGLPASFPPSTHGHAWSELTAVPADLLDGDSDTLAGLTCGAGQQAQFNGASGWGCVRNDPVADVAAADSYVRNNGDTITGDVVIQGSSSNGTIAALRVNNGSTASLLLDANEIDIVGGANLLLNKNSMVPVRMHGNLEVRQDTTLDGNVTMNAEVETRVGDPAIDLDQEGRKYVMHYPGLSNGNASARLVPASKIDQYCGDIDGCTLTLIEAGYTAGTSGSELPRRRASGPHAFMTDLASRFWSVDNAGSGRQGQWGTTTGQEVASIGECAFVVDQLRGNGGRYEFSVTKKVADTGGRARICTLVITD